MTPLRQRMIEDMRIRNLAVNTQSAYCGHIRYSLGISASHPSCSGRPEDIRTYRLHLVQDRHLASSSISVAVAAIRFLYKITLKREWDLDNIIPTCRKQHKLPVVLSLANAGHAEPPAHDSGDGVIPGFPGGEAMAESQIHSQEQLCRGEKR